MEWGDSVKILYITTVGETMEFFTEIFKRLIAEGHTVELACSSQWDYKDAIAQLHLRRYDIPFSRSPFSTDNLKAYLQLKRLVRENHYDIVHCHTPNAAVMTRLACKGIRKNGTKVIYTAHGFHFFKGAPRKNWLVYYPVEWLCAHWTDILITINKEDYALAKKKMKAGKVKYVPGVGVDTKKFKNLKIDRKEKRTEIGIPEDAFFLLSVGELNDNKNHATIVKAIAKLHNPNIYYAIAGRGSAEETLVRLAESEGIQNNFILFGYRDDIPDLNYAADVFCFPSKREGLGLGAVEAMLSGLPIVTSNVHGINDYSQDGVTGYKCAPMDVGGFAKAIDKLYKDPELRAKMGTYNRKYAEKYDVRKIIKRIGDIYESTC